MKKQWIRFRSYIANRCAYLWTDIRSLPHAVRHYCEGRGELRTSAKYADMRKRAADRGGIWPFWLRLEWSYFHLCWMVAGMDFDQFSRENLNTLFLMAKLTKFAEHVGESPAYFQHYVWVCRNPGRAEEEDGIDVKAYLEKYKDWIWGLDSGRPFSSLLELMVARETLTWAKYDYYLNEAQQTDELYRKGELLYHGTFITPEDNDTVTMATVTHYHELFQELDALRKG